MTAVPADARTPPLDQRTASLVRAHSTYLWLGLGAACWLFAVGGRFDLPLAAWAYPALLLRFSRMSRPTPAIGLTTLAAVAAALCWAWQLAVPLNPVTTAACVAYGLVYAVPFAVDRIAAPRLDLAGRLLLFPAAHASCEFLLASFSPQGACYGLSAMTQTGNLPLLQLLSVTGPYGIGFLIALAGTAANLLWEEGAASRPALRIGLGYTALLAGVVLLGGIRLATAPSGGTYARVAGIVPSSEALAAAARALGHPVTTPSNPARSDAAANLAALRAVEDELLANTERAAAAGAQVVVWSENAAVIPAGGDPTMAPRAAALAARDRIYLDTADNIPTVHDETRLFDPAGTLAWTYQKAHPIPGLEPYRPGAGPVPVIHTAFGRLANVICYDADFPPLNRVATDIMLVPGGDWPEMGAVHTLKMARLRAIENGYALFRQDFNGLSAAFDPYGRLIASQDTTPPGQHLFFADLPSRGVATLYRQIGDLFAWLCVAGATLLLLFAFVRPNLSSHA